MKSAPQLTAAFAGAGRAAFRGAARHFFVGCCTMIPRIFCLVLLIIALIGAPATAQVSSQEQLQRRMTDVGGTGSNPPNVVVKIETDDGPVGDVFSAMFIGDNGPLGPVVSAFPRIGAVLPPGDYIVLLVRANDQRTIELSLTAAQEGVTTTAMLPPLSPDAPRMRLVQVTVTDPEPSDRRWNWQFVQGDRITGSRGTAEPAISVPLPVGEYVIRLRRGQDNKESRAALAVETGTGPLDVEMDWAPRTFGDDAVAQARIIPREPDQGIRRDAPVTAGMDALPGPDMTATYDAPMSQIVVQIAGGGADFDGGTIWLTDGTGPGGLDVAFIDQRGEARFSTLNVSSDQLAVELRDASGLNIRARTLVEDWK